MVRDSLGLVVGGGDGWAQAISLSLLRATGLGCSSVESFWVEEGKGISWGQPCVCASSFCGPHTARSMLIQGPCRVKSVEQCFFLKCR